MNQKLHYAIPLAGQPTAVRVALLKLIEAPGLVHDVHVSDTYIELRAHFPSPGQLVLWEVGVSIAGFGVCDLRDVMTRLDDESRAAAFAAIAAAGATS